MLKSPESPEIDSLTLKLLVGLMALTLAPLTTLWSGGSLTSISASYWTLGHSRDVFVGFLFAIAAFLASYNGDSRTDMVVSRVAAGAAMGIALFPCRPDDSISRSDLGTRPAPLPVVHDLCAAIMFLILAYFCRVFFLHAREKGHREARRRSAIYAACGLTILGAILVLAIDHAFHPAVTRRVTNLTFYGEWVGLVAFGISWLTASRTLPYITRPAERHHPLRERDPGKPGPPQVAETASDGGPRP